MNGKATKKESEPGSGFFVSAFSFFRPQKKRKKIMYNKRKRKAKKKMMRNILIGISDLAAAVSGMETWQAICIQVIGMMAVWTFCRLGAGWRKQHKIICGIIYGACYFLEWELLCGLRQNTPELAAAVLTAAFLIAAEHDHDMFVTANEGVQGGLTAAFLALPVCCTVQMAHSLMTKSPLSAAVSAFLAAIFAWCVFFRHIRPAERKLAEEAEYRKSAYYHVFGYSYGYILSGLERNASDEARGDCGEWKTAENLERTLGNTSRLLFSVYIPVHSDIGSTEADCICISPCGIDVIEIKNWKNRMVIDPDSDAVMFRDRSGHLYTPQTVRHNPFRQNSWHITALQNYLRASGLNRPAGYVGGYVVYGPASDGIEFSSGDVSRYSNQGYARYDRIGEIISSACQEVSHLTSPPLSDSDIEQAYQALLKLQNNSGMKKTHQENIRKKYGWKD